MNKPDKIAFKGWVLNVIDANNELIRLKVLIEPSRTT